MTPPTESRTITCQPTGICAWNFLLADAEGGPIGQLQFTGFFGRPIFDLEKAHYSVFSGHTLMQVHPRGFLFGGEWMEGTEPLAVAQHPYNSQSDFEIQANGRSILLQRNGPGFDIVFDGAAFGSIKRTHSRTKRASITCDTRIPVVLQLFCLVLALQRWRKEAYSD